MASPMASTKNKANIFFILINFSLNNLQNQDSIFYLKAPHSLHDEFAETYLQVVLL